MSDQPSDRRRFRRIAFNAKTELKQNGQQWPVQLVDLSLKGLLVQKPAPWLGKGDEPFDVDIHLDADTDVSRLIELNLGDEEELHRELGELLNI